MINFLLLTAVPPICETSSESTHKTLDLNTLYYVFMIIKNKTKQNTDIHLNDLCHSNRSTGSIC